MTKLADINGLPEADARAVLAHCCGATRWAAGMAARRPFVDVSALHAVAVETWRALGRADWLEAFAAHPRIGAVAGLRAGFAGTAVWSAQEQQGVVGVDDAVLHALAEGNRRYEAKFGHIFIVCATGKSAAEMLALLDDRLGNAPDAELRVAAAEQEKIMLLRLRKLCS